MIGGPNGQLRCTAPGRTSASAVWAASRSDATRRVCVRTVSECEALGGQPLAQLDALGDDSSRYPRRMPKTVLRMYVPRLLPTRTSPRTAPVTKSWCTGRYRSQSASPTVSRPPAHGAGIDSSRPPGLPTSRTIPPVPSGGTLSRLHPIAGQQRRPQHLGSWWKGSRVTCTWPQPIRRTRWVCFCMPNR